MDKVVAVLVAGGVLYLVYKVYTAPNGGKTQALIAREDYINRPLYLGKNYNKVPMGTDIVDHIINEQRYFADEAKRNPKRILIQDTTSNPQQFLNIHA